MDFVSIRHVILISKLKLLKKISKNFSSEIKSYKLFLGDQIYCPLCLRLESENPLACWDCGFENRQVVNVCLCECCMLSGRFICDKMIVRQGECYRLWCVVACDIETSTMLRPWTALGRSNTGDKPTNSFVPLCTVL